MNYQYLIRKIRKLYYIFKNIIFKKYWRNILIFISEINESFKIVNK